MQLRKYHIKFQRLQYIFISHLHGDHFLGIFGLLTSMNLTGRTSPLTIFAPGGLKKIVDVLFKESFVKLSYEIEFVEIKSKEKALVLEDEVLEVFAFPVKHRIPTWGFLFHQKEKKRRIEKSMIDLHQLTIEEMRELKSGRDIRRGDSTIPNRVLTLPPQPSITYAFCADTAYFPRICEWIKGCDLLFHEATFTSKDQKRAKETMHSTAAEAARIAVEAGAKKLILGHFSARYKSTEQIMNEAIEVFSNSVCVQDGDVFTMQPIA